MFSNHESKGEEKKLEAGNRKKFIDIFTNITLDYFKVFILKFKGVKFEKKIKFLN
jgi:hypothetical protein